MWIETSDVCEWLSPLYLPRMSDGKDSAAGVRQINSRHKYSLYSVHTSLRYSSLSEMCAALDFFCPQ